ncbi:MAG: serine aminopeptidase domain-containing protein, partial [Pseudomonadales bacterium]
MIQAVDKPAEALLTKVNLALPDGTSGSYYIYPEGQTRFKRVLVYVHGLISDQNWFRIPKNLPDDTGILFLLRQPRTHAEHFATWTDNYEACMEHYRETHHASWYHLIAQCYGTQIGLHWSMTRPESFDSQTLVCPPVVMRQDFSVREKFGILFGAKKQFRRSLLHPSTYGRLPSLIRFIKENPTTTFTFSNSFFMQTGLLRRWLKKYLFTFSVPTHCIYFSDDEVQEPVGLPLRYDHIELPDRRTFMFSYHYAELLPNRDKFWDAVFTFQLEQEREFEFEGTVDTVLVTGATGFLGAHIVRGLHADGKKVIVFARNLEKANGMFRDLGERVEYREGSLSDIDSI